MDRPSTPTIRAVNPASIPLPLSPSPPSHTLNSASSYPFPSPARGGGGSTRNWFNASRRRTAFSSTSSSSSALDFNPFYAPRRGPSNSNRGGSSNGTRSTASISFSSLFPRLVRVDSSPPPSIHYYNRPPFATHQRSRSLPSKLVKKEREHVTAWQVQKRGGIIKSSLRRLVRTLSRVHRSKKDSDKVEELSRAFSEVCKFGDAGEKPLWDAEDRGCERKGKEAVLRREETKVFEAPRKPLTPRHHKSVSDVLPGSVSAKKLIHRGRPTRGGGRGSSFSGTLDRVPSPPLVEQTPVMRRFTSRESRSSDSLKENTTPSNSPSSRRSNDSPSLRSHMSSPSLTSALDPSSPFANPSPTKLASPHVTGRRPLRRGTPLPVRMFEFRRPDSSPESVEQPSSEEYNPFDNVNTFGEEEEYSVQYDDADESDEEQYCDAEEDEDAADLRTAHWIDVQSAPSALPKRVSLADLSSLGLPNPPERPASLMRRASRPPLPKAPGPVAWTPTPYSSPMSIRSDNFTGTNYVTSPEMIPLPVSPLRINGGNEYAEVDGDVQQYWLEAYPRRPSTPPSRPQPPFRYLQDFPGSDTASESTVRPRSPPPFTPTFSRYTIPASLIPLPLSPEVSSPIPRTLLSRRSIPALPSLGLSSLARTFPSTTASPTPPLPESPTAAYRHSRVSRPMSPAELEKSEHDLGWPSMKGAVSPAATSRTRVVSMTRQSGGASVLRELMDERK